MKLLLLLVSACAVSAAQDICRSTDSDPYRLTGSRAAYTVVRNPDPSDLMSQCRPLQTWILSRHAARYPSADQISQINQDGPALRDAILATRDSITEICDDDLDALAEWPTLVLDPDSAYMLAGEGYVEGETLGQAVRARLPGLLNTYDPAAFDFRHTDAQRTEATARAFAKGVFGDVPVFIPDPENPDVLIQPDKNCPKWDEEVVGNPESLANYDAFSKSDEFTAMMRNVDERTANEPNKWSLSDIKLMHMICSFEQGWFPTNISPFCSLFDEADMKVLEYWEDLKLWWWNGYGYEITGELACPLVADLVNKFGAAVEGSSDLKGTFYFTHTPSVQTFATALGLNKDPRDLTSTNYAENMDRAFQASKVIPVTSNVEFDLWECDGEVKVTVRQQEYDLELPGCDGLVCDYQKFLEILGPMAENCDVESLCQVQKSSWFGATFGEIWKYFTTIISI